MSERGRELAAGLGLSFAGTMGPSAARYELVLVLTHDRLELRETRKRAGGAVYVDFVGGPAGYRRVSGRKRDQLIGRAVGLRSGTTTVLDATAGLCRDAFLLACLGCRVSAVERSAVVAALIRDGLERGRRAGNKELTAAIDRITFEVGDAQAVLAELRGEHRPDVVYVDPMYRESRGRSLSKKELRVLRQVVGDDVDAGALFEAARAAAGKRVVVKRHRHAPPIAQEPDIRYRGRTIRYDVYVSPPR